jgi:hypothetical protein
MHDTSPGKKKLGDADRRPTSCPPFDMNAASNLLPKRFTFWWDNRCKKPNEAMGRIGVPPFGNMLIYLILGSPPLGTIAPV